LRDVAHHRAHDHCDEWRPGRVPTAVAPSAAGTSRTAVDDFFATWPPALRRAYDAIARDWLSEAYACSPD